MHEVSVLCYFHSEVAESINSFFHAQIICQDVLDSSITKLCLTANVSYCNTAIRTKHILNGINWRSVNGAPTPASLFIFQRLLPLNSLHQTNVRFLEIACLASVSCSILNVSVGVKPLSTQNFITAHVSVLLADVMIVGYSDNKNVCSLYEKTKNMSKF